MNAELENLAFVFPGQGSQYPGMGQDLACRSESARALLASAEALSGRPITKFMNHADAAAIADPEIAQLLVFVSSMVLLRELEEWGVTPTVVAGHSLGEYSALVAAGSLEWETALSIIVVRGRCMAAAARRTPGSMAAIVGLPLDVVREICAHGRKPGEVAVVANMNSQRQVVVSGTPEAVLRIVNGARAAGALRARVLPVGGAFHSPLMTSAEEALEPVLRATPLRTPRIPLVSSVTGAAVTSLADYRGVLIRQITSPVRWQSAFDRLEAMGARSFVEVGPGRVLTGLGRQMLRESDHHLAAQDALRIIAGGHDRAMAAKPRKATA